MPTYIVTKQDLDKVWALADDLAAKLDRLLASLPEHWHDDATIEATESLARYRETRQQ